MARTNVDRPQGITRVPARSAQMVSAELRDAVAARITRDPDLAARPADRARLRLAIARALASEGVVVAPDRWARLVRDLVDDLGGLGPVEALLRDPAVTDVMINGPGEIWVERDGQLARTDAVFSGDEVLLSSLRRVLGPLRVRLDASHPWADAVLPGGVRLHALLPPLVDQVTVTLRRVPAVVPSWSELESLGSVNASAREILVGAVHDRRNMVLCGQAGVGKTTLLSRLLAEVGDDRLVIIEDAAELSHPSRHCVHLHVRPSTAEGVGAVDAAMLLRNALRMRPDRLVVGEVRGPEVADMLQAMNTGHDGSATTVHANGPQDALVRLEGMALLAGLPLPAVRAQLAAALDLVIALERGPDRTRRLASIGEVVAGVGGVPIVRPLWP
jgi:pilus assembly protein CpaF